MLQIDENDLTEHNLPLKSKSEGPILLKRTAGLRVSRFVAPWLAAAEFLRYLP